MTARARPARSQHIGTAMLEQLADLESEAMSRETAERLLDLNFSRTHRKRAAHLSVKAQDGTLTPPEQDELDEYIRVADLLAILQSRARRCLNKADAGS